MKKIVFFCLYLWKGYTETVAVVGSGYVGLVLSGILAQCGHEVICIDANKEKITLLNQKILPIFEPGLQELLFEGAHSIHFTHDINVLQSIPIIYCCIGTPPDPDGYCDCSGISQLLSSILSLRSTPCTICIKSTISPGTIQDLESSFKEQSIFTLVYNPEFMREGSAIEDIMTQNPIVLGSRSSLTSRQIEQLYSPLLKLNPQLEVIHTTPETAELIKYGWNGLSAIRISYINELSHLCNYFDADITTLMHGISWSEKLLPTDQLKPGCGYGGSCLPKDSLGLSLAFETIGLENTLIHQAIRTNQIHTDMLINRVIEFIGDQTQRIAILGTTFKANTDDTRYAPSIPIIEKLLSEGHTIRAYDAHGLHPISRLFPTVVCCTSPYEAAANSDCIIFLTDSEEIQNLDWSDLLSLVATPKIIDFKNLFSPQFIQNKGFSWINLGRTY